MKRKIPSSFKLYATTITVDFDDKAMNEQGILGESDYVKGRIRLAKSNKLQDLSYDAILDTFYHEKVHMILDTMREDGLSGNEKFVEQFSRLLRQSDETEEL